MGSTNLYHITEFQKAKPVKAFIWFLIFALVLVQCPKVEAAEIQTSSNTTTASSSSAKTSRPSPKGSSGPLAESSVSTKSALTAAASADFSDVSPNVFAPFKSEFYRTDLLTGTASLSIPIVVPSGRKGIQPNLSLSYSSSAANSWCGVGWNLALGRIERDTRKGIPAYDDTDTFIATINGANAELVHIGDSEYRAKIESGFLKFIFDQAGNYWEVYDKQGTKYRFGYTPDSNLRNPYGTLSWSLDEVVDKKGNYMTVSYVQDHGQIYPSQIQYTGNKNTGYLPEYTVDFILEARTDFASNYRSGWDVTTASRLKEIAIKVNTEWVRRYVLNYEYSPRTARSILTSLVEYGSDGLTPSPAQRTFTYSAESANFGATGTVTTTTLATSQETTFTTSAVETQSTQSFAGDNLWNVCFVNQDRGHENHGPEPPFTTGTIYTQASYDDGGKWWQIDPDGDIHLGGNKDHYMCAWTYLYVAQPATISLSYFNMEDPNEGVYLSDETTPTPWQVNKNSIPLSQGYNILYITAYNENRNFRLEMEGSIASQVDLMNSSALTVQPRVPIIGDFNGDGRLDRGKYYKDTGTWQVALSEESGLISYSTWLSGFGGTVTFEPIVGDFNSDGLTDIGTYDKNSGDWTVALSDGTQFNISGKWLTGFGAGLDCEPVLGDFNGDGLIDVGIHNRTSGDWTIALNANGSGFVPSGVWRPGFGAGPEDVAIVGDFNGDGFTDVGIYANDVWNIVISYGASFSTPQIWAPSFGMGKIPMVADVNDDGFSDAVAFNPDNGNWEVAISNGTQLIYEGLWITGFGSSKKPLAGDFNGDGVIDPAYYDDDVEELFVADSSRMTNDLLVEINNGIGGNIKIDYTPSTKYDNTLLPFPVQTVSSVTISDGQGNSYATNYNYQDGFYDAGLREFRGFGYVKVIDAEGNYTENYFKQDDIYKGRLYKQEVKDSGGNLYSKTENILKHRELYPGVYFSYVEQSNNYTYDGDATFKQTSTKFEYDDYGNVTKVISEGDASLTGDEKTLITEYTYNTVDWLLSFPKHTYLLDEAQNKVTEKWFYYDNHTSFSDPPSKGLLTQEKVDIYNPITLGHDDAITQYSYDDYGNLTSATDALGRTTATNYDTQLYTFPIEVINDLGQKVTSTYDYKTGQVLTSTDTNNQTTEYVYDVFGRLIKVIGPLDSQTYPSALYEYDLTTHPVKVTKHSRVEHSQPATLTTCAYYDGLGRLTHTELPAEDDGSMSFHIVSGLVRYDSRGKVKEKYLPYFILGEPGEGTGNISPPYFVPKFTFSYDPVGREVKTTNPDATYSTVSYSDWVITATDENGHYKTTYYDAYGRIVKIEEHNQGQTYTTAYEYDTQGNLTKLTDNQANITQVWYDSLGRKIKMDDPDMGVWIYEYDKLGNLVKQTDAKGQVLEFIYDRLNRLTNKLASGQTIVTYIYDEVGKDNCKGRLSKVIDQSGSTEFFYDTLGREIKSIKTIDGNQYVVERSYDAQDRLKSVTYPNGLAVNYTYNKQGSIETVSAPNGSITNIDYTASNQIKLIQYSNSARTQYDYDPNTLRLTHLATISSSQALQDLTYSFDNVGNVASITDNSSQGSNTQSFQYDDLNRLTSATGQSYGTVNYQYDSIGNMIQKGDLQMSYGEGLAGPHAVTQVSGAKDFTMTYDTNGNMLTKGQAEYQYDLENRLTQAEIPQSSQTKTIEISLSIGWNFISIPLDLASSSIASVLSSIEGKYDQVSRYNPIASKYDSFINNSKFDEFSEFSFGEGYMIHIISPCTLTITANTPSTQKTKLLKAGWNLIASPTTEDEIATDDALGNLVQGTDYSKVAEYNGVGFIYDPATLQKGKAYYIYMLQDKTWEIPLDKDTTTFVYDGDGGRVKKTTQDTTTTYIGSLYEVRQTPEGTQAISHVFYGSNRAFSIESTDTSTHTYYYHQDHLGSSNVITDETGSLAQLLEYTPYGLTSRQEGTYNTNYKFTGKEYDSSSALCYYGARYYDAEIGRFISADSIVQAPYDPQSLNRYTYCRNNPVNLVDPTGHFIVAAIIGAILGGISAAVNEQPIWQGVLMGAVGGAMVGAGASAFGLTGAVVGGAMSGAGSAAVFGGDIGIGALVGGFGAGLGYGLGSWASGWNSGSFWGGLGTAASSGAVAGGLGAELQGGKFGEGAWMGASFSSAGYLAAAGINQFSSNNNGSQDNQEQTRGALDTDLGSTATEKSIQFSTDGQKSRTDSNWGFGKNIGPGGFYDENGIFRLTIGPYETVSRSGLNQLSNLYKAQRLAGGSSLLLKSSGLVKHYSSDRGGFLSDLLGVFKIYSATKTSVQIGIINYEIRHIQQILNEKSTLLINK